MPSASRARLRVAISGWFWDRPETGSGQYVRRIVDALAQVDPDLDLMILLPFEAHRAAASASSPPNVRFTNHPIRHTNLGKLRWEQMVAPSVARALNCTLLHVPYWAPPACSALPTIVTVHDIIPRILPAYRGDLRVRLYTAFVSATACRANLILTDSQASRDDIIRQLRITPERVRAIPLAVGPAYTPQPGADDQLIRAGLDLPERYLLYLGGFDVRKNLRVSLSAFKIVHETLPDVCLVIAGQLPEEDTLFTPDPRRMAHEFDLNQDALRFLDFVPESHKPALYRGARAFVFPSTYEGFGYPPLEAISCGVPVVAGNSSSLPEVVGAAGVLLDSGDVEGMAGALIQLIGDDAFHQELSQRAIEQSRIFSWNQTATQTAAAYRAVVGVNQHP